jgi:hypothetical protein
MSTKAKAAAMTEPAGIQIGAVEGVVVKSTSSSKRPSASRGGIKSLITVGALAATALGWFLYGQPGSSGATVAQAGAALPPGWTDLLAPLPTIVPASAVTVRQSPQSIQPVLRSVSLAAPAPVTITRSSR